MNLNNDIITLIKYYKTNDQKLLDQVSSECLILFEEIKNIDYIKQYFLTFDNNLIDEDFDGDVFDKLYKLFEQSKEKSKKGKGYKDIFFHFDKYNPNIFCDGIVGINSFVKLYSKEYNKIIYLLGEYHDPYVRGFTNKRKKIFSSSQFVINEMKYSQTFIDLFLEFHPDNTRKGLSSQIAKLEEYWREKKENNVKIHYVDIRLSKYIDQTIILKYYMEIYWLIQSSLNKNYYKSYDNLKYWIRNDFDYITDEKNIKHLTKDKETCILNIWKEFLNYSILKNKLITVI